MSEPRSAGFGPENLPYGVVALPDRTREPAVRLHDSVVRLPALADAGLLGSDVGPTEAFQGPDLNGLLRAGCEVWAALRLRLRELVDDDRLPADAVWPLRQVNPVLPVNIGDYVDMYSSIEHATNVGAILRPGTEPLLPNWRHLPVGYHGRTSTIAVSGTGVRRPVGQLGLSNRAAAKSRPGTPGPRSVPSRTWTSSSS